jgi:hypothetical protein
MNPRALLLATILLSGSISLAPPASAIRGGELPELKVLSHHWTSRLASDDTTSTVDHPDSARFLVLKLSANLSASDVVFGDDFVLVYRHPDGSEDRAATHAMASAATAEPGEFESFFLGKSPRRRADSGPVYFGLAYVVESDVETIEVHPIAGRALPYRIGADRPYSLYISTNQSADVLPGARRAAEAAVLQVVGASTSLDAEKTGATLHYAPAAEDAARELAARLHADLGLSVDLQPMELIADSDLVLWLGLP